MELMPIIRDRVIKGDAITNVGIIMETHDAYAHYNNRWKFLGDSYQGGYDYFTGRYLEPYYYESREDYEKRLRQVALDNHVKSVVGIYNSFLFRKQPKREYGALDNTPGLRAFLQDADLDGRSYDSFMRDLSSYTMVYGNTWVIVDKPISNAMTRAEELQQEIRPYVSMFTPENVLDWEYTRQANGLYTLTYLKVKEEAYEDDQYIREYTPEEINVYKLNGADKTGDIIDSMPNPLGKIPAVCVYAQRSNIRGVGVSAVGDIADIQKELYEFGSEIEQIIRLTNHPSLVLEQGVEASAGAGAIIQMPPSADPAKKPYLLQPDGASIEAVLDTMERKVNNIDRMACLGGIRSIESRRLSGIGLQTEFQMLNAKLADFAMNLEHAEEQIWRLWAEYQGDAWEGEVEYPRSFSIQDKFNDVQMLKLAKDSGITDPTMLQEIDGKIYNIIFEKEYEAPEAPEAPAAPAVNGMEHPTVTDPVEMVNHIRAMVNEGFTNDEIIELHPELAGLFSG